MMRAPPRGIFFCRPRVGSPERRRQSGQAGAHREQQQPKVVITARISPHGCLPCPCLDFCRLPFLFFLPFFFLPSCFFFVGFLDACFGLPSSGTLERSDGSGGAELPAPWHSSAASHSTFGALGREAAVAAGVVDLDFLAVVVLGDELLVGREEDVDPVGADADQPGPVLRPLEAGETVEVRPDSGGDQLRFAFDELVDVVGSVGVLEDDGVVGREEGAPVIGEEESVLAGPGVGRRSRSVGSARGAVDAGSRPACTGTSSAGSGCCTWSPGSW